MRKITGECRYNGDCGYRCPKPPDEAELVKECHECGDKENIIFINDEYLCEECADCGGFI